MQRSEGRKHHCSASPKRSRPRNSGGEQVVMGIEVAVTRSVVSRRSDAVLACGVAQRHKQQFSQAIRHAPGAWHGSLAYSKLESWGVRVRGPLALAMLSRCPMRALRARQRLRRVSRLCCCTLGSRTPRAAIPVPARLRCCTYCSRHTCRSSLMRPHPGASTDLNVIERAFALGLVRVSRSPAPRPRESR